MQLYTVGHSTVPIETFIDLIKKYDVQYVIDVRSTPYSRYASQFNTDVLESALKSEGIGYSHMGRYFGARQESREFYNVEGYLDFELFRESELFKKGLRNIEHGLEKYNIALMCTEKDPIDCHRAIMVGRGFELDGIPVKHILHSGEVLEQHGLNRRLLDMYFPDRAQTSLFDDGADEAELLFEAYRLRNKEIGYRLNDESEEGDAE